MKKGCFEVIQRVEEIQENSKYVEYENLFDKYFNNVKDVTGISSFKICVLWDASDWVLFLPYISAYAYRKYLDTYIIILQSIVDDDILKKSGEFDYYHMCIRWWLEGVKHMKPVVQDIGKGASAKHPFHIDVTMNGDMHMEYTCIGCELNLCCQMNGMGMKKCSDMSQSKKCKHCFPGACIHLCSKHSPIILDIEKNRYGLNEIYTLNDGRNVISLPLLKHIHGIAERGDKYYNTSSNVLFHSKRVTSVDEKSACT